MLMSCVIRRSAIWVVSLRPAFFGLFFSRDNAQYTDSCTWVILLNYSLWQWVEWTSIHWRNERFFSHEITSVLLRHAYGKIFIFRWEISPVESGLRGSLCIQWMRSWPRARTLVGNIYKAYTSQYFQPIIVNILHKTSPCWTWYLWQKRTLLKDQAPIFLVIMSARWTLV